MLPLNPDLPDSPSFFLQDCVQLNQYKLQSEIGKVGLGPARAVRTSSGALQKQPVWILSLAQSLLL